MPQPHDPVINVLLLEDSPADVGLVQMELRRAGLASTWTCVDTEHSYASALSDAFDVILADFDVPGFGAVRALELLKRRNLDVPLIVVSGSIGEEMAVELLRAGASDYLLKDRLARLAQAVTRAISERQRRRDKRVVEEALSAAEGRMRFALEAAHVGVWEADLRTGRQTWSEINEALHGLAPGAFEGTVDAFVARIHPEDRETVAAAMAAALTSGGDSHVFYRTVWPDGTLHWLAGRGRTFCDADGRPVRSAGIAWDVTDRHQLEEQYRQAQKMEAVGLLAGGVAHDFNNLLTAIQGYCSLLVEALGPESPHQSDLFEIGQAANRATALTRQLLAFSRKQTLDPQVLNLGTTVEALQPMLRRLIGEDIEILTHAAATGRVRADPGQIEQVVVNLALNARDAMPRGGTLRLDVADVAIRAERRLPGCGREVPAGDYVRVSVTDTGSGMDEATRVRIFEPFFTTKPVGQGTGLGLSTVFGIVTQSGGHICVETAPGRGAAFSIYLPCVHEPVTVPAAPSASTPTRGSETILVAEDEDGVRRLVQRVLVRPGYRVLMAATPSEALAIARDTKEPIHLLLSDVVMPQMTGAMLAEHVLSVHPEARVLYMSGYTANTMLTRAGLEGDVPFLPKPFSVEALLLKVRELLDAPAPGSPRR